MEKTTKVIETYTFSESDILELIAEKLKTNPDNISVEIKCSQDDWGTRCGYVIATIEK